MYKYFSKVVFLLFCGNGEMNGEGKFICCDGMKHQCFKHKYGNGNGNTTSHRLGPMKGRLMSSV